MFNKIITSSTDPAKVSLFLKSLGALAILWGVDSTVVEAFNFEVLNLVTGLGMVVSAGTALWGLVRKVQLGRWSAQ